MIFIEGNEHKRFRSKSVPANPDDVTLETPPVNDILNHSNPSMLRINVEPMLEVYRAPSKNLLKEKPQAIRSISTSGLLDASSPRYDDHLMISLLSSINSTSSPYLDDSNSFFNFLHESISESW